jgi:hypothetical protein
MVHRSGRELGLSPAKPAVFSGMYRLAHVVYVVLNVLECLTRRMGYGPGS